MSSAPVSQEQWEHFLEAWRIFDTDADGLVTPKDLRMVLKSFGYEHSEEEIGLFLDDLPVCVEKDRALDLPQFILWIKKLAEKIVQEQVDADIEWEEEFEKNIPAENSRRALKKKEHLKAMQLNRALLQDMLDDEQLVHHTRLFEEIDVDENGFLTYQDIERLSKEVGERWKFNELDDMMYVATSHGEKRMIRLDKFISVMKTQVAWDEPDLLPCQKKLLDTQAENRLAEEERLGLRKGAKKQITREKGVPRGLLPWYKRYCAIM